MAKSLFSGFFGKKNKTADAPSAEENVELPAAEESGQADDKTQVSSPDTANLDVDDVGVEHISSVPEHSVDDNSAVDEPVEETSVIACEEIAPPSAEAPPASPPKKQGFFSRLKQGLARTSGRLSEGVASIFTKRKLDDETLEELEDLLISSDLGVPAAGRVIAALSKDRYEREISDEEVKSALADEVIKSLAPLEKPLVIDAAHKPHVILMTGVNGAGKTTTIGKLAAKYRAEGKSVMLAAGDTFRAAAIEQLSVWGERVGASVVARDVGADAAGLAFDALKQARDEQIDVLLIDTAGRLQNRTELMEELAKIVRVVRKIDETAPHDTLLVLDATVGQNALSQTKTFTEIAGVSGLVMTKLDGTARGGVLVALGDQHAMPIHYIGVGEGVDDLQPFSAERFARALVGLEAQSA